MKVVINRCYGGFGLSKAALSRIKELGGRDDDWFYRNYDNRSDPLMVQAVEELGEAASGELAELKVVEIPDDVEWVIEEYDGVEWVSEQHRTWG